MRESGVFDIDVTGGGVRGRVVEAGTGAPVGAAEVSLWLGTREDNTPAATASTGDQGAFDFSSQREGRYRVVTSRKGYGQQVREVGVPRGGMAEVVIELQPAEGVTLTVTDARDGRPLEAIVVVRDGDRRIVANRHAGADAEGAVTIPLADGASSCPRPPTGTAPPPCPSAPPRGA